MSDTESGIAQIQILLSQHITDTQIARAEAAKNLADLSSAVKTIANDVVNLRGRLERTERAVETTNGIAIGARNHSVDLQTSVQTHVAKSEGHIRDQFIAQNKILEAQTRELGAQTRELDTQGAQLTALVKFQTVFETNVSTIKWMIGAAPVAAALLWWLMHHLVP